MKNLPAIIVLSKALIVLVLAAFFYFTGADGTIPLLVIGLVMLVSAILLFVLLPPKKGNKSYF